MSRQSLKEKEKQDAIAQLRTWIPEGGTVYTILRSVSRSGMQRLITPIIFSDEGNPYWPTYAIATACGYSMSKNGEGIIARGCGYDAANAIVEHLRHELGYASLKQVRL
jgi:hypothetical protein